jgi:GNAT superfamily N-acetyltransferase
MRASEFVLEGKSHDFMAGHCHVMAVALKQLHPDWQIRAHVGYDDDAADDTEYRVDHVYTVAPDGTAYDCRGRFDNEQQLVGPDTTGGVDTQYVNFGPEEIKQAMLRGELKRFTKQDLANAMQTATQVGKQDISEAPAGYKEIEFVCVNPQFPDATDPALQKKMYRGLKQIDGVVPLWQEWGDYSESQASLSAIYQGSKNRDKILSLAKQLGVEVDLEQAVSADYVDRAMRGEHEGQQGLTEEINPDCFDPAFNDTQIFDGLTYRATAEKGYDDKTYFQVKVFDSNFQQVGLAKFSPTKRGLVSAMTSIQPEYQGQGLARNIYAYVRSLGNTIAPSRNQLPPGKAMWDSWKKSGDAKYLMRNVAEGLTEYKNTPLQDYNGLQFMIDSNHPYLRVEAFAPGSGQQLAQVDFKIDDQDELHPEDLHVEERWRGQGIAKVMYDYVKSQGYTIHRSWSQTDAGSEFWNKHRGQKRVWEQGVAENFADGKGPGRPGDSQRHGIPKGATMAQLEKAAKAPGRKGQLARWQLNMRRGQKK